MREVINQPFGVTETKGAYDVIVNVNGGGYAGQSGAIRHGIARALLQVDPDFRSAFKNALGYLLVTHVWLNVKTRS